MKDWVRQHMHRPYGPHLQYVTRCVYWPHAPTPCTTSPCCRLHWVPPPPPPLPEYRHPVALQSSTLLFNPAAALCCFVPSRWPSATTWRRRASTCCTVPWTLSGTRGRGRRQRGVAEVVVYGAGCGWLNGGTREEGLPHDGSVGGKRGGKPWEAGVASYFILTKTWGWRSLDEVPAGASSRVDKG